MATGTPRCRSARTTTGTGSSPAAPDARSTPSSPRSGSRRTGSSPTLAHVDAIAEAIAATDAKLVVLDSFMAYMPLSVNSHKDQHIRYALGPRVELAAGARAAMLVFRHLNKAADGDPLYRAGGNIGIIGAVRSGLILAPDPDDDGRTVLASTKANLARKADSLTFSIAVAGNGAPHTAEALLAVSTDSREDRSAIAEAADFLRSQLGGGPVAYSVLKREAAGCRNRAADPAARDGPAPRRVRKVRATRRRRAAVELAAAGRSPSSKRLQDGQRFQGLRRT